MMFYTLFLLTLIIIGTYQQDILNLNNNNNNNSYSNTNQSILNINDFFTARKNINNTQICGYSNPNGINNSPIIEMSPHETKYGEYPWMVAIFEQKNQYSSNPSLHYLCGGSLIHPSIVLTSANCVYQKIIQDLVVRTGEWNLNAKLETIPEQDQYIKEIIIHEQFNSEQLTNDIALLFFSRDFKINNQVVRPICIPTEQVNFDYNQCVVTGWGKLNLAAFRKPENFLKKIEKLSIISRAECQKKLRTNNKYGRNYQLSPSFLCANDDSNEWESSVCGISDEGSPLICKIHGTTNRYYQAGIVSKKLECDAEKVGLYVNLPVLRSWLDKIIQQKNIDSSFFTPDRNSI